MLPDKPAFGETARAMYKGKEMVFFYLSRKKVSLNLLKIVAKRVTKNNASLWQEGRFLPLSSHKCPFGPNKTNGTTTFVVER